MAKLRLIFCIEPCCEFRLCKRVGRVHDQEVRGAGEPALTARERDTLRLVASGLSSKEIAARLGIGVKTTEWHRQSIMDKLGIRNVPGLVKWAIRHHLTRLEE